jgi:hypothetical protein
MKYRHSARQATPVEPEVIVRAEPPIGSGGTTAQAGLTSGSDDATERMTAADSQRHANPKPMALRRAGRDPRRKKLRSSHAYQTQ